MKNNKTIERAVNGQVFIITCIRNVTQLLSGDHISHNWTVKEKGDSTSAYFHTKQGVKKYIDCQSNYVSCLS